jgi:tRNA A64-2'-O-ribosylphosphate transferase
MPDALAKTIPIWCVVINRLLFGHKGDQTELYTPRNAVGLSEHAQIESRLDGFVQDAKVPDIQSSIKPPLSPVLRCCRHLGSTFHLFEKP